MTEPSFENEWQLETECCQHAYMRYGLSNLKAEKLQKGFPDRVFFRKWTKNKTVMFFVEFKDEGEEASKFQQNIHDKIRLETGIPVYVVDNYDQFKEICYAEVYP